jgi:predicted PurR-regulated permease PerM
VKPLKSIFPSLFASQQFSSEIGSVLSSFTSKVASGLMNAISQMILDFPNLALQFTVIFFTFFFVLRDREAIIDYVKSLLPFSKDIEKKLFDNSKLLTSAILYGQVIIGIVQGIVLGIGLFIFGVKNALILTLFAALAGILPIIGTAIIWLPVAVYLFVAGNTVSAWGVIVFGILSSTIDNILRPIIVSRKTKIHSGILVVSMIGGIFLFGIMGFILGPLIVSYLLIILEIYRGKPTPGVMISEK